MARKANSLALWAVMIGLWLTCPGLALAQNATATQEYTLDAITVEAQKREQDIQEVPVSVNALSDVTLEEGRIYDFNKLDLAVPNLNFRNYGSRTNFSLLSIRGFAASDQGQDPTVGVYVDDIPITDFLTLSSPALFDLERVEVLRGPQSTLWGLNTQSGAVLLFSKDPGDEWSGMVKGEYGSQQTFLGQASVGGPLFEDTLYMSMAVSGDHSEGHVQNIFENNYATEESAFGVRGKLIWTPIDDLEVRFTAFADHITGETGFVLVPLDHDAHNRVYNLGLDEFEVALDNPGKSERFSNVESLKVTLNTDWFDVVSISSRREVAVNFGIDADNNVGPFDYSPLFGLPAGSFETTALGTLESDLLELTQEIRLLSPDYDELPLEWILGAFYLNKQGYFSQTQGFPEVFSTLNFANADTGGDNLAFFGQATYRLFDEKLGLTAGLRYEIVNRHIDRNDDNVTLDTGIHETQWLPRFGIDYRFTDNIMAYATVAKGWRNGGLNPSASTLETVRYDKEISWNYEVGAKTRFFDDKLQVNLAAFYTDVEDYQASQQTQGGAAAATTFLGNVEHVGIWGFEAEMKSRPLEGLDLEAGFGWVDSRYIKYQFSDTVNYDGNRVADVPDWELSTAAQYTFPFGIYLRGEFQAVGTTWFEESNTSRQQPYEIINARVGYQDDGLDVYVFGENLTDRQYHVDAYDYQDGLSYGPVGKGLTIGAGVSYNF